jgi:hypothetical protein
MNPTPLASLLLAVLVRLRQPCSRNRAVARLLLEHAAEHDSLSPLEREACLNLAEGIEIECAHNRSQVQSQPLAAWSATTGTKMPAITARPR